MKFMGLNKNLNKRSSVNRKRLGVIFLIITIAFIVPSIFIFWGVKETASAGQRLVSAYKEQNFDNLRKEVKATKGGLMKVNIALIPLFWLKAIPILGGYFGDVKGFVDAGVEELTASDKLLADLEPAKSELGFDNYPKKGPDRITQAIKILEKSIPNLNKIEGNLKKGAEAVKNINTDKYPEQLAGRKIRQNLKLAKNFILGAAAAVSEGKDALNLTPQALGSLGPQTYLLLFQNDKEIRPTGGFLTAFATLTVNNGQITTTTSDDIYRLDEHLLATCQSKICPLTPPSPIVRYLPEVTGQPRSAWSMRDSNISPDLLVAAKEFERMFQMLGQGLPFDGIIFIDTNVVEELIEITGPIEVFGTIYSAETDERCSCPNVIYELQSYANIVAKGEQDRKAILGVLMQQILAKTMGADVEKLPALIEVIARLANHKHIMFYMHDENFQNALSKLNWTGRIREARGDYLHINDANFAGGKSNLYVKQTVTQEITIGKQGEVRKKITIEYENPQPFGIWLNGINRSYVRFYVPIGSKLISGKGSEDGVRQIDDDLGKSVFEAFVTVRPGNSRRLELEYTIPYNPKNEYQLLIQKQPGAKDFQYKVKINGRDKVDLKLDSDTELKFGI